MIAKVVINSKTRATDRLFDYNIPKELENKISVGMRVKVPFGRSNKHTEAYIYSLSANSDYLSLKDMRFLRLFLI